MGSGSGAAMAYAAAQSLAEVETSLDRTASAAAFCAPFPPRFETAMIDDTRATDLEAQDLDVKDATARAPRRRITLDSQLISYWEREAQRLDALAAKARWGWMARGFARRAERARAQGARSAAREAQRDDPLA